MKNFYVLLTMLFTFSFGSAFAQGTGLCSWTPDSIKQEILSLPHIDGKCVYLLVLEDTGADGWDGASIDVAIAEEVATNYKVPSQDSCMAIPLYVEDGEIIDLTYWNGANEDEHSFYLYDAQGNLAADDAGVQMAVGPNIPANTQFRVKTDCPYSGCDDEQLELEFFVIGSTCPDEPVWWEIRDSNGDIAYSAGPTIEATDLNQDSIYLDKCEQYMIVLGSSIGTDWGGLIWQLRQTDPRYGQLLFQDIRIVASDAPAPGDFADGMRMYDITIPCTPEVPETIVVTGGDPTTCTYAGEDIDADGILDPIFTIPLVQPVMCYPQMEHMLCANKAVTVEVTINPDNDFNATNDVTIGSYEYDHLDVYCDGNSTVVDTDSDGTFDAVQLDYSAAFPNGIETGSYTICYEMEYNCQDFGTGFQSRNVTVNNCATVIFTTTANPILACNDLVNITLNYAPRGLPFFQLCQNEVTPDQLMEDFTGCPGDYLINIEGPLNNQGVSVNQNSNYILASMAGGTYPYTVTHVATGNVCWGELKVEDKEAPFLECFSYDAPCNHPDALTLTSNNSRGYTETTDFCIDQEQAIKVGTVSPDFSNQLTGGNQIAFPSVGCTPLGEIIKKVELIIDVNHSEPRDIVVHLVPPVGAGLDTIRLTTSLMFSPRTFNVSHFFFAVLNNNPEIYADFAGEWQVLLTDVDNPELDPCNDPDPSVPFDTNGDGVIDANDGPFEDPNDSTYPNDPGYGTLTSACLRIQHGYPDPYDTEDCNPAGNPQLLNEELIETNCDQSEWAGMTVRRVWQAVDQFGNSSTCVQTINLIAPTFDQIQLPGDASFECGELTDELNPDPIESGIPAFDCFDLVDSLHHAACDYSFSYDDLVIPTCGSGKKVIRTWTLVSWCSGVTHTHEQIIKIEDTTGPAIDTDAIVMESTDAYDCAADVDLMSAVTDACSGVQSITARYVAGGGFYSPNGTLTIIDVTNGEQLENLPFGITEVEITAVDSCFNETVQVVSIDVFDGIAPVAICDNALHVSLGADGTARIYPEDFDEGSYDNCGDVTLKINNNSFFFRDFYEARCSDIGTVTLYLEAEDENGNTNTCWAEVIIEDALPPVITCPADKTLNCDDDLDSPFGTATALDNCTVTIDSTDAGELDQCKAGTLTRTWTATDGSDKSPDVSCTQRITVLHVSDFTVQFPADATINTCPDDLGATGSPQTSDVDCELLGITHDDVVLTIAENACYTIERTWTVINTCIYDQGNPANTDLGIPQPLPRTYQDDGDGYFTYVQIIEVIDNDAPTIDCPGDQNFCDLTDGCEGQADLTITATDGCSQEGSLTYSYSIDAFNDNTFDIVDSGNDASGVYPYGTHRIKWVVEDGCGNTSTCEYLFTVEDCKNPTPVCLNGVSIENMQTGCVDIWASDLLEYAFDNCSDASFVEGSVKMRREGALTSPQTSMTLCCEDVGTVIVEIWVEDEAGNADYCTTYIIVQDNLGGCDDSTEPTDDSRNVAGTVRNENGDNVENVTVEVNGQDGLTGTSGGFMFPGLTMHNDYTITPAKDMNPLNGVSTFDLVLISQHVLGQQQLNTPYKMIAADINNDGNISTFDVVQLRQLILYIVTDFVDNSSWRFVDAHYMFPNVQNPWMETFPEVIEVANLSADEMANDFVAVKIGDVNDDAQANSLLGADDRNVTGTLQLNIDDATMTKGQAYTVDFRASDFENINGYQFTFNFDAAAMTFVNVEAGALNVTEGNFGMNFLNEGVITTSWNNAAAKSVANDEVLFSMTFTANEAANLSEVLSVSSRYTNAEAYSATDLLDVALTFNTAEGTITAGGAFELYQNTPNPFNGETVIGFNLPTAATASLKIYDVAGRTLKVVEGEFNSGYNTISVDGKTLNATGVLYYELNTPSNSATRKMILLD